MSCSLLILQVFLVVIHNGSEIEILPIIFPLFLESRFLPSQSFITSLTRGKYYKPFSGTAPMCASRGWGLARGDSAALALGSRTSACVPCSHGTWKLSPEPSAQCSPCDRSSEEAHACPAQAISTCRFAVLLHTTLACISQNCYNYLESFLHDCSVREL